MSTRSMFEFNIVAAAPNHVLFLCGCHVQRYARIPPRANHMHDQLCDCVHSHVWVACGWHVGSGMSRIRFWLRSRRPKLAA